MGYLYETCDKIIRFLPSIVAEKNATKNILEGRKDGQTDRGKTVYPPSPSGSGGKIKTGGADRKVYEKAWGLTFV